MPTKEKELKRGLCRRNVEAIGLRDPELEIHFVILLILSCSSLFNVRRPCYFFAIELSKAESEKLGPIIKQIFGGKITLAVKNNHETGKTVLSVWESFTGNYYRQRKRIWFEC